MIYHGYDTQSAYKDWRVTYLDKLVWNEETGMPQVEGRKASNHEEKPGPYIKALEE